MDDALTLSLDPDAAAPLVRTLSRSQRRVLGVLLEKGFTTPDQYPLTLKSLTSGSNQKSNRNPVTNYSEDAVEETIEDLRKLGLLAVVHTESGRTERYRHFMRKRYTFSETQLAVLTELFLRGKQQLGELRSRASRMVPIDSLATLRDDLHQLAAEGFVLSDGSLDRRGAQVDHGFYTEQEQSSQTGFSSDITASNQDTSSTSTSPPTPSAPTASSPTTASAVAAEAPSRAGDAAASERLSAEVVELRAELESLRQEVHDLTHTVEDLKRDLGA